MAAKWEAVEMTLDCIDQIKLELDILDILNILIFVQFIVYEVVLMIPSNDGYFIEWNWFIINNISQQHNQINLDMAQ